MYFESLSSDFVIDLGPARNAHAPSIILLSPDHALVVYHSKPRPSSPPITTQCLFYSIIQIKYGTASPARRLVINDARLENHPLWNPLLFHHNERVILMFRRGNPKRFRAYMASIKWDQKETIFIESSEDNSIFEFPEGYSAAIRGRPFIIQNNTLVMPGSREFNDGTAYCQLEYFDLSKGKLSCKRIKNDFDEYAIQPTCIIVEDGYRLYARGRSEILSAKSSDGLQWSPLQSTKELCGGSGFAILSNNEQHLICHNPEEHGRYILSLSRLKTSYLFHLGVVEENLRYRYAYPALESTGPGKVLVAYSVNESWIRIRQIGISP